MTPARRLEDRIRELCSRLSRADDAEAIQLLSELRAALNEQTQRFQKKISATLLTWRESPHERRKARERRKA